MCLASCIVCSSCGHMHDEWIKSPHVRFNFKRRSIYIIFIVHGIIEFMVIGFWFCFCFCNYFVDCWQEVWTLCRIFKRNVSYRKYTPDWRQLTTKCQQPPIDTSSKICSPVESIYKQESYVSFGAPLIQHYDNKPPAGSHAIERKPLHLDQLSHIAQPPSMASSSNMSSPYIHEIFTHGDWDELRSVVECAFDPFLMWIFV